MRTFDAFEKEILKKIGLLTNEGLEVSFTSLLDNYLENKGYRIEFDRKRAYLLFDGLKYSRLQGDTRMPQSELLLEVKQINEKAIKIIILINYLEKEGYLYRLDSGKASDSFALYARITNDITPISYEITDQKFVKLLSDYFNNYFYLSQGLLDDIASNFSNLELESNKRQLDILTESLNLNKESFIETKQSMALLGNELKNSYILMEDSLYLSNKSIKYSDIALGMAILLGVIGTTIVGISTYYTLNALSENSKKINNKLDPLGLRIKTIEENFAYISHKLENITIKDTIHTKLIHFPKDTIYTKVVNHVKTIEVSDRPRNMRKVKSFNKGVKPFEP